MCDELYLTTRGNRYGLYRIGHKNGRRSHATIVVVSCSHLPPMFRCMKHNISLSIVSPDMPTPNCICWPPLDLQAMEDTLNALRLTSFLALFYARVDAIYKQEHSTVLYACWHSVRVLRNLPLTNLAWSTTIKISSFRLSPKQPLIYVLQIWNVEIIASSNNFTIYGEPKMKCNIFQGHCMLLARKMKSVTLRSPPFD